MNKTENQNDKSFAFSIPPGQQNETTTNQLNATEKGEPMLKFNAPKNQSSIIKVIGVGGGGSNAVNHMYKQGIKDVDFIVCNTDAQALETSPVPNKIQLGPSLTEGRGAGSIPEVGKNSAVENIEEIRTILSQNTKMLFITAGMGGGTGTGAAPVIAALSKEMGILTVGIVTIPFSFEGRKRRLQAEEGIKELRKNVDSLLIICNDKLRELYGNLELSKAFGEADNVLTTAAKGIAEIITVPGYVNVDFEDVRTVMKDSGVAIMGAGIAEGDDRAIEAVKQALSSPLLNDNNIQGASDMLLYISSGKKEVLMDEITEITEYIQQAAGATAEVIWGNGYDEALGEKISITLISTGFESSNGIDYVPRSAEKPKPQVIPLEMNENREKYPNNDELKSEPVYKFDDFELKTAEPQATLKETESQVFKFEVQQPKEEKKIEQTTPEGFILYKKETHLGEQAKEETKEDFVDVKDETQHELFKANKPTENQTHTVDKTIITEENQQIEKLTRKRQDHLKELSIKLKNPNALAEMEKIPAYMRKEETLKDIPHSSESQISRYTLSMDDENQKPQLKANNSFLHEKPD